MTEGMENLFGSPPNGPRRPTLTSKWCARLKGVSEQAVTEHVEALRQHLADMIEEELRKPQELPSGGHAVSCRIVCPDGRDVSLSPGATCEVGRGNLGSGFTHVSRVQATVSLDATGSTVRVVSLGGNPTGVRAEFAAASWMWLAKGDSTQVGTSAQLCLDLKRTTTTEALLSVELVAAVAPPCAAATGAPSASGGAVRIDLTDGNDMVEPGSKRQRGNAPGAAPSSSSKAKLPTGATVVSLDSDDDDPPTVPRQPMTIEGRADNPGRRIIWGGAASESLAAWLHATRPSLVSPHICAWVQVHNDTPSSPGYKAPAAGGDIDEAHYLPGLAKLAALATAGRVPAAAKEEGVEHILSTAREHRFTTGKWMLFVPQPVADDVWRKIARATADGALGCSAKIAPTHGLGAGAKAPVCCVYVGDFDNRAEVRRVLFALLALNLGVEITAGFKPDAFTCLGIMSKNKWRLPSTIYGVEEVKGWPV